jgi:hypothetical protein
VVEWQQRLNNSCDPEKAEQAANEKEHFPGADFSLGKMALSENNTDYKKDEKPEQLEKLKPGNVIYQFYFLQSGVIIPIILFQITERLPENCSGWFIFF